MDCDEKWIYFQNPKRKKSWVDPVQPSTSSSRPNRFGRKTKLCVWWDQEGVIYYELLKPGETVNASPTTDQIASCSAWKKAALSEKTNWFSFMTHHRTRQQWSKTTWRHSTGKCYPIPLTQTCTFWLSPVFVDGPRAHWAALRFLRRRPKMAWWVVCLERWGIFLAWYIQIARKMGKIYS